MEALALQGLPRAQGGLQPARPRVRRSARCGLLRAHGGLMEIGNYSSSQIAPHQKGMFGIAIPPIWVSDRSQNRSRYAGFLVLRSDHPSRPRDR